jgi:signal transduction histidine kinase
MDVRTTSSPASAELPNGTLIPIDHEDLRAVLSSLSHELCRPLVSLKAGFDLLLGDSASGFTPNQRDHLQTMVSLCDDLLRMTRSYLDYAGIVQGSRPVCLGSFTIGALIQEIARQFAPIAATSGILFEAQASSPQTTVVTDASRCQQIVGNLVSNALKYTPAGGTVRIVGQAAADSWSVTVSDSGPGIPADALEMVFEPFFRLTREEHSGIEGNGLGLSICRELVAQLQGKIDLSSVIGQGTSVSVRFPLTVGGAARARSSPGPSGGSPRNRSAAVAETEASGRPARRLD